MLLHLPAKSIFNFVIEFLKINEKIFLLFQVIRAINCSETLNRITLV